ncbi:hypothetical protein D3C87_1626290 [compost metagenome]
MRSLNLMFCNQPFAWSIKCNINTILFRFRFCFVTPVFSYNSYCGIAARLCKKVRTIPAGRKAGFFGRSWTGRISGGGSGNRFGTKDGGDHIDQYGQHNKYPNNKGNYFDNFFTAVVIKR